MLRVHLSAAPHSSTRHAKAVSFQVNLPVFTSVTSVTVPMIGSALAIAS